MALGLFKKFFGGDSRPGESGKAEQEVPDVSPAAADEEVEQPTPATPDPEPAPVFDVTPRPATPPPDSRADAIDAGSANTRSQTFRVEPPGPRRSPVQPPPDVDAASASKQRSQTFRVQDLPPRQGLVQPPPDADAASASKQRSQTFRVQDLPPRQGSTVAPKEADVASASKQRSQTFRVETPPPRQAARPAPTPVDSASASKQRSQTFRVPDPQSSAPTAPEPAPVAKPKPAEEPVASQSAPAPAGVSLPLEALSVVLPEVLCGPAFDIDRVGEMTFTVPKGDLLSQLSTGQVSVALADIAKQLPPDWIADTTVQVVLDLPTIVAAIPPELLMPGGEMVEDAEASASLGSFFSPREGVPEVADGEEAVSAAAAEAPAAPVAEPQPVESGPMVALAASAVLEQLPENLRGPAWSADLAIQDVSFPVADLVRQLATGRVAVPAAELAAQLPANVLASVDGEVELPLDVVVMSIPPEALSIQGEEDEDVAAAARLGSFFAPTAAAPDVPEPATPPPAPEPAEAVPEPELAPVEPTPQPVPEPVAATPAPPPPEGATLIPVASLLATVPANLRGPAWSDSGSPEGSLVLASDEVLGQLRTGRVAVSAQQLAAAFPAGWLVPNADGQIELPLDQVVAAVPSDVMALTNDTVDMVAEAKEIPDLFGVGIAVPSVPQETAPAEVTSAAPVDEEDETVEEELEPEAELPVEPSVSVAAEKSPAPRAEKESTKVEHDWDGVEQSLERAPRGVDINSANLHELATLPGVGETRGEAIVRYREEHGRFESIYDLARVPGIGPSLFRKMTGISLGAQGSRHDRLNSLLDLPQDRRPFLSRLANALMDQVGAVGCVLTDRQGLSLAKVGEMATEGDRYAALGSRYFIKTKRHLQQFVGVDADCLIVPGCNPPLLLLCAEDVVMVLALRSSHVASKRLSQARRAMSEVAWLLGCRAVVLKY